MKNNRNGEHKSGTKMHRRKKNKINFDDDSIEYTTNFVFN